MIPIVQQNDEIRVLSGEEINHVAGGGWFTDLIKKGVQYVISHPQEAKSIGTTIVNTAKKVWNWLF